MAHLTIERREGEPGVNPRVYVGEEQVEIQHVQRMQINFEPHEVPRVLLEVVIVGQPMQFAAELETIVVGGSHYDRRPTHESLEEVVDGETGP